MATILIIDDDKSILRLLEFTLQRAGHTVITSVDSGQALVSAQEAPPNLLIVDVMMPGMTGYEFCRKARATSALKNVPILLFSARFQSIDREAALEAGATDYLSKTTSPNELLRYIAELLPAHSTLTAQNTAIGLFSLRGGSGLTSLAINLAAHIAHSQNKPTSLIDLARLGGHTALMLGLHPTISISQALDALKYEITVDSIKPYLLQHSSGLEILTSVSAYDHQLLLTDDRLKQLVTTFKSAFEFTVLDIPHILESTFAPTLQLFNKITLVLSPDRPSIQSTTVALQGLARLGIPDTKIKLVVNHTISSHALSLETIQDAVRWPILSTIPFDAAMVTAVNEGTPLVLSQPESHAAQAIINLAELLLDIE